MPQAAPSRTGTIDDLEEALRERSIRAFRTIPAGAAATLVSFSTRVDLVDPLWVFSRLGDALPNLSPAYAQSCGVISHNKRAM